MVAARMIAVKSMLEESCFGSRVESRCASELSRREMVSKDQFKGFRRSELYII
jgi:hypothetical protein